MFQQDHFDDLILDDAQQDSLEKKCVSALASPHLESKYSDADVYIEPDQRPSNRKIDLDSPFSSSAHWKIDTQDLDFASVDPVLGSGSIGVVVKATFRGTPVAVKILRVNSDCKWKYKHAVLDMEQELAVVSQCQRHPNIIFCFGCCSVDKAGTTPIPMIVYEYLGGGSLLQVIQRKTKEQGSSWVPPTHFALSWCHQLSEAVNFLHTLDAPVAHRDIKLDNLLVTDDYRTLKLTDFSLAASLHQRGHGQTGSLRYMAPEAHTDSSYDLERADVYSVAITMWCILHGRRPFHNVKETPLVVGLVSMGVRPTFTKDKFGLQKIVEAGWSEDPSLRPAMAEIVSAVGAACKKQDAKPWKRFKNFLSGA
eukprot:CAMPEP_0196720364 /NCGR_PEP_ID=MMETSP1091-20130531/3156_1 /TAXON_ID=302021 /ORGANISM="Rhodomonas sp., Strain CCMP768" /LENGTH=365 /DNA_ID=CAMNT_0042061563 /DNA_START=75 /DNA_END=1172 /DNA_ORIENTATION=-